MNRVAAFAGGAALASMALLVVSCDSSEYKTPETTTVTVTTTVTAPQVTPTEKGLAPGGPNSFTPSVTATPAPTAIPGDN